MSSPSGSDREVTEARAAILAEFEGLTPEAESPTIDRMFRHADGGSTVVWRFSGHHGEKVELSNELDERGRFEWEQLPRFLGYPAVTGRRVEVEGVLTLGPDGPHLYWDRVEALRQIGVFVSGRPEPID